MPDEIKAAYRPLLVHEASGLFWGARAMSANGIDDAAVVRAYVRGELSESDAAAFEERYFADEALARLVEAEQLLVQAGELLREESRPDAAVTRRAMPTERRLAWAAALLLAVSLPGMLYGLSRMTAYRAEAESLARQVEVLSRPFVTATRVRLSSLRAMPRDGPPWRLVLPADGAGVVLVLPVPDPQDHQGGVALALYPMGDDVPVWQGTAAVLEGTAEVTLRQGTLAHGTYRLRAFSMAEDRLLAEFFFELVGNP